MLKKLLKIAGVLLLTAIILAVGGFFVLKSMYPPEKVKSMLADYTQKNFHREVTFSHLSFNWIGVTLKDFALSENTTFEQGTFIKADKLVVKVAFKPLLQKRIEIEKVLLDGLDVQIIKNQDGSFNFDSLFASEQTADEQTAQDQTQQTSSPMALIAKTILLSNSDFSYKDMQSDFALAVKKLNIAIKNFDLANPFQVILNFTSNVKLSPKHPQATIPVEMDFTAFLADLNMPDAYVTLDKASATYQKASLSLKGQVKDFTKPNVDISGTLTGIDNELLKDFAPDLPAFSLPDIKLIFQTIADLDAQSLALNQATINLSDSAFSVGGLFSWKDNISYNMKGTLSLDLAQAVQMTDTMTDFRPTGTISGTFAATDKKNFQDVSGVLTIKDTSLMYDNITLSALSGTVTAKSLDDISSDNLSGLLNNEKISASFSYKNIKDVMNIVFKLNLDKLKLDAFPNSNSGEENKTEQTQEEQSAQTATASNWRMNLKSDITIGEIEVPYFKTSGAVLNADLTNITPNFDAANGQLSFDFQPGAITGLDSVLFQNKIVKILLLPFSIVNKVSGILGIEIFPTSKGELAFSEAAGDYTLTDGLMTLNKTIFKSKLTDISGSGTINFKTEALDMKMKASVTSLTQGTPMVIKIGGTLSDPKGSLDVLNTVGSVVGGILSGKMVLSTAKASTGIATGAVTGTAKTAANAVTGTAKVATGAVTGTAKVATGAVTGTAKTAVGAVKAIGGLFKKSNKDEEEKSQEEQAEPAEQTTSAEQAQQEQPAKQANTQDAQAQQSTHQPAESSESAN